MNKKILVFKIIASIIALIGVILLIFGIKTLSGEDFNQFRKFRNGAEAVPAILRQKYNIDRMPVRGLIRTRHFFGFKIGGLAFNKYLRFLDRQNKRLKRCA